MKKIKKLLSLFMVAVLMTALCSCGGGNSAPASDAAKEAEAAEAPAESEEETAAADAPAADAADEAENTETETAPAAENTEAEATPAADAEAEAESTETEIPTDAEELAEQYNVADLPVEGNYTLFAVRNQGYTVSAEDLGASSSMILEKGGKGSMTMDEETMDISNWSLEGDTITITLLDESTASGKAKGGVIELDIYGSGEMLMIYAQEEADTSGYELLTVEEVKEKIAAEEEAHNTRLGSILKGIDPVAGAHMRYQVRMDKLGAVQEVDVHVKDGVYYSAKTTKVGDAESTMVTFIKDSKAYNLYPEEMTGRYVTDVPLSVTNDSLLLMDNLYSEMRLAMPRTDKVEEEREAEGATYPADVYPETDTQSETVFFYTDDGQLAYCYKATPVIEAAAYIGDSFYTVEAIDTEVDESLFDISAYTIEE